MSSVRRLLLAAIFGGLAVGQLFVLARIQGASCLYTHVSALETQRVPNPDFHIAGLTWPVSLYAEAPELQPFRDHFDAHCAGLRGQRAALCISAQLADHVPWGAPKRDFLARGDFDPAAALRAHLAGEPAHCVSRSGIVVTELLSRGIPARVVQIIDARVGFGHTLTEVWDQQLGWTLVDPSFDGYLAHGTTPANATDVLDGGALALIVRHPPAEPTPRSVSAADILYPAPWLYMRIGPRNAPWPFHERFVHAGSSWFNIGIRHMLLRSGIVVTTTAMVIELAAALWERRRRHVPGSAADPIDFRDRSGSEAA